MPDEESHYVATPEEARDWILGLRTRLSAALTKELPLLSPDESATLQQSLLAGGFWASKKKHSVTPETSVQVIFAEEIGLAIVMGVIVIAGPDSFYPTITVGVRNRSVALPVGWSPFQQYYRCASGPDIKGIVKRIDGYSTVTPSAKKPPAPPKPPKVEAPEEEDAPEAQEAPPAPAGDSKFMASPSVEIAPDADPAWTWVSVPSVKVPTPVAQCLCAMVELTRAKR